MRPLWFIFLILNCLFALVGTIQTGGDTRFIYIWFALNILFIIDYFYLMYKYYKKEKK